MLNQVSEISRTLQVSLKERGQMRIVSYFSKRCWSQYTFCRYYGCLINCDFESLDPGADLTAGLVQVGVPQTSEKAPGFPFIPEGVWCFGLNLSVQAESPFHPSLGSHARNRVWISAVFRKTLNLVRGVLNAHKAPFWQMPCSVLGCCAQSRAGLGMVWCLGLLLVTLTCGAVGTGSSSAFLAVVRDTVGRVL